MKSILDLRLRHFYHVRGDLTVIGTWADMGDRIRPCIVIIRTGEELNEHTWPCIITSDKAWIWEETIGDPRQAAQTAFRFCQALRMSTHQSNIFRLVGLIVDHLHDLLHIPPYMALSAPAAAEPVAEVTIRDHRTGRTTEVEL
ncbi:hypothetical protein GCM10007913_11680 [Devosia yakushimensis]|uniref:Uncharacterized protein n=1 Tax=Devosia yakushimensis TaxID=470028 RepID=A0ABQ5UF90_9HYPH|nr:hypothetical protein [Devosia yakushimensis]GLQ09236.1 hypothetical protein GCM10007913_11680 [Devosia yakushimensis]